MLNGKGFKIAAMALLLVPVFAVGALWLGSAPISVSATELQDEEFGSQAGVSMVIIEGNEVIPVVKTWEYTRAPLNKLRKIGLRGTTRSP